MNQPTQQPEPLKMVSFEIEWIQQLVNYLVQQPYVQVFQFISKIQEVAQASAQGALNLGQQEDEKKESQH